MGYFLCLLFGALTGGAVVGIVLTKRTDRWALRCLHLRTENEELRDMVTAALTEARIASVLSLAFKARVVGDDRGAWLS